MLSANYSGLNESAINDFFSKLPSQKTPQIIAFPLNFDNDLSKKVTLYSLATILQSNSQVLPKDFSFLYGIIAMHINSKKIDAEFLMNLSVADVADYFNLPLFEEKKHDTIPGLTMSEMHPVRPVINAILKLLNDIGSKVRELGFSSLGDVICDLATKSSDASAFVEQLVANYPFVFDDISYDGVKIHRKAKMLTYNLHHLFAAENNAFDFKGVDQLVFFQNEARVLVAMQKLNFFKDNVVLSRSLLMNVGEYIFNNFAVANYEGFLAKEVQIGEEEAKCLDLGNKDSI